VLDAFRLVRYIHAMLPRKLFYPIWQFYDLFLMLYFVLGSRNRMREENVTLLCARCIAVDSIHGCNATETVICRTIYITCSFTSV
jgi:hypothetical protein